LIIYPTLKESSGKKCKQTHTRCHFAYELKRHKLAKSAFANWTVCPF